MKQSVRHVKTVKTPLCVLSIAMLAFAAFARTSLPDGYCELEYIQSTGKQIIDTGYKMNPLSKIAVDFQLTSAVAQDRIFGNDSVQTVFRTSFYANANKIFAFSCGDTFSGTTFSNVDTKRHQAVLDAANKKTAYKLTTDGVTTTKENKLSVTQTAPYSETLFARFTSDWSNVSNGSKMKLYSCQMYESEEPVREFVPCKRLADEVIGLYDCIGQQFYTNAAPGETQPFAAGPVVPLISVSEVPDQTATGYELTPEPVVTQVYGEALTKGVDYAISYEDNVIAGTGKVVVTPLTAKAGYGTVVREFTILNPNPIKADQYASDGILGHWEAIENAGLNLPHDPSATTWVDLAGGEGWTLTSHGSWKNGKAFYCDGKDVAGTCPTSQYSVVAAEIAFNMAVSASGSTIWMSGQRTGGYSAYFAAWNNQMTVVRGKRVDFTVGQDTTLGVNYTLDAETGFYAASAKNAYLNGAAATVVTPASSAYNDGGGAYCTIGARTSSTPRPFKGNIYAIRLYSRELTADEARKHADLDAVRYFGAPLFIIGDIPQQTYDGVNPCEPKLYVTNRITRAELVEGTDYRVVYRDNAASGTATASVYGLGTLVGYGNEQSFIVVSKVFETPGELDDVCTVEYSPTSADLPVFSGSVKTFGDGEVHTVRLLMGTDPDEMSEAASVEVTAEGPFEVAAAWCDYGLPVYYRFVYETSDGEKSYYSDTSNSSEPSPDYTATYAWKGGAEADWAGSDSWTVSDATVSNPKPYPFSETLHAVIFPSKANATVRLKGGEACLYIQPNKGASFRLQGVGDEPVPFTTGIIRWYSAQNVTCVCDRVAVRLTNVSGSTDNSCERFGTGSLLRFENGGSISVSGVGSYGVNFGPNTGYTVEVDGGAYDYRPSPAANYSINFSGQSRMLVRDGLVRANTKVSLCNAATGPSAWTFEGMAPRIVALAEFGVTGAAGTSLVFKPGATGFAEPAISVSNKVAFTVGSHDKGPVTVSVPKDAGIWKASARQDVVLISAPKGINTNVIEFAQMPRSSGTFVYLPEGAENPTSLVFRYRPRGTVLILK